MHKKSHIIVFTHLKIINVLAHHIQVQFELLIYLQILCMLQDSQIMGLQGTTCKRKLDCESGSATPSKVGRMDDWSSDQYLPSGNTRYQYNLYEAPTEEYRSCYQAQQTIRCDENGKSYLDLGSWSGGSGNGKCCEGRTSWCARGPSCYRQRRLAVLNISMCKLGRYRQFSDPSLHRSVLICNTLRLIEKEMEQEGYFNSSNSNNSSQSHPPTPAVVTHQPQFPEVPHPYEPPRVATPFPSPVSDDSSTSEDRSINWGSVLSLSSQSDLDPLNNNDSDPDMDDFLPTWKLSPDDVLRRSDSSELDSIMHVLVGT